MFDIIENAGEITGDYWRLLEITGDHMRSLEMIRRSLEHWRLLEITGNHWRLLEITRLLSKFPPLT